MRVARADGFSTVPRAGAPEQVVDHAMERVLEDTLHLNRRLEAQLASANEQMKAACRARAQGAAAARAPAANANADLN